MCLSGKYKELKPCGKISFGYKAVKLHNNKLTSEFYHSKTLPMKQWLDETDYRHNDEYRDRRIVRCISEPRGGFGWNIFLNKNDAFTWLRINRGLVVVRVKFFWNIAIGESCNNRRTIIAKYIKITSILNKEN